MYYVIYFLLLLYFWKQLAEGFAQPWNSMVAIMVLFQNDCKFQCDPPCLSTDVDSQSVFEEKLIAMPISEVTYLLTTFANMARFCSSTEIQFIETVALEIFEVLHVLRLTITLTMYLWQILFIFGNMVNGVY